MKMLVMGTGGIGGYFGGRLAAARNDLTFVARGDHLQAILRDGLQVLSPNPNFSHKPAKHLILLEPRSKCSHKLFQIPIDTTQMQ
jgi:ketopantoate reductase